MKTPLGMVIKNDPLNPESFGRHYAFTVELINEYVAQIECYEVLFFMEDEDPSIPMYLSRGATNSEDTTANLEKAQKVFEGRVKWDGCSDMRFYPDAEGYSHYCGRGKACDLGLLMNNAYDIAKEVLGSTVYEDCFEG